MHSAPKCLALTLIAATCATGPAFAQQDGEGRRLAQMAFASMDGANRGFIDQCEFSNFGGDGFVSMESDDDNRLTLPKFLAWEYGMAPLAREVDREAALRVVFAFWDRDGDGEISRMEHRQSLNFDFQRADTDGDAILTEGEFTSGFSVMVALRAAINPAPVEYPKSKKEGRQCSGNTAFSPSWEGSCCARSPFC